MTHEGVCRALSFLSHVSRVQTAKQSSPYPTAVWGPGDSLTPSQALCLTGLWCKDLCGRWTNLSQGAGASWYLWAPSRLPWQHRASRSLSAVLWPIPFLPIWQGC